MGIASLLPGKGEAKPTEIELPAEVKSRIDRGRARMREDAPLRNQCIEFWRGNQYCYVNSNKNLINQPTAPGAAGKPRHRVRQTRNLLRDVVEQLVSSSTGRIPDYEITPSTIDPDDIGAARLAEKVARYGYDKWHLRDVSVRTVTYAVVADQGFAMPFFDTTIGDRIEGDISTGEIVVRVFGPNEVFWEPGIRFLDSRWHCIEQARPIEQVIAMPGYLGGNLTPDAKTSDVLNTTTAATNTKLVLVTEYLERPCSKYPQGRRVVMANGRVIAPIEPYPLTDPKGNVVDEPCLHSLSFIVDPSNDRDQGLVRDLLDAQRTYNDSINKALEWKNLALAPQLLAPIGSMVNQLTDEPGAVFEYNPSFGQVPQWRPVPPIPAELFELANQAKSDIEGISAQNDVASFASSGTSGVALQALLSQTQTRNGRFWAEVAEFHSRLMRHCLWLVQQRYSEPRLLHIRGRFGPELETDFRGADLRGQADVTVLPGSIEPRTRAQIEQRVMNFAQLGWISPEAAMSAINGGNAEALVESHELDVSRANSIIQKIRMGPEVLFAMPKRPDGTPGWMPRKFDNLSVQKSVFQDWMKTSEYDALPLPMQEAAETYYAALEQLEAQKQAQDAAAQQAQAQALGMSNAAKPQAASPLPSLPSAAQAA